MRITHKYLICILLILPHTLSFTLNQPLSVSFSSTRSPTPHIPAVSEYGTTSSSSKTLVSTLTNVANSLIPVQGRVDSLDSSAPPTSTSELLQRISEDYTTSNYLWTGDIDTACFTEDCKFTDPTITFTGLDTFLQNTNSLAKIIPYITYSSTLKSTLNTINNVNDDKPYILTTWKMYGKFKYGSILSVSGSTKFYYNPKFQISEYEEKWDIPVDVALRQLLPWSASEFQRDKKKELFKLRGYGNIKSGLIINELIEFSPIINFDKIDGTWKVIHGPHFGILEKILNVKFEYINYIIKGNKIETRVKYKGWGGGELTASGNLKFNGDDCKIKFNDFGFYPGNSEEPFAENVIQGISELFFFEDLSFFPIVYLDEELCTFKFPALGVKIASKRT